MMARRRAYINEEVENPEVIEEQFPEMQFSVSDVLFNPYTGMPEIDVSEQQAIVTEESSYTITEINILNKLDELRQVVYNRDLSENKLLRLEVLLRKIEI